LPVPANERAEILPIIENSGKDLGEVLEVLLPAQLAEVANEGGGMIGVMTGKVSKSRK